MKKVSIIMGIYNCADTLSYSIESILEQSYKEWELILCDDCSNDGTAEIASDYANKNINIKFIRNEKNMGLAFSLNRCLELASGDYIARMDGDDICLKDRLDKQVKFLEENSQYDVVGSSVILFDQNGEHAIRKMKAIPNKFDLIQSVPHIHPTIMMRKLAYDELGGYVVSKITKRGQDMDLWFRFYANGYKGYNMQEPLLKYHESINDYKKRSWSVAIMAVKRRYNGYRLLKLPAITYIYALKPIVSAMIPNKIMYIYHKRIKGKSNDSIN